MKSYLADPPGSVLFKYIEEGKLERTGDGSITEGAYPLYPPPLSLPSLACQSDTLVVFLYVSIRRYRTGQSNRQPRTRRQPAGRSRPRARRRVDRDDLPDP